MKGRWNCELGILGIEEWFLCLIIFCPQIDVEYGYVLANVFAETVVKVS